MLQLAIPYLSHSLVVAFPLSFLGLETQVLHHLLVLLYLVYKRTLALPFGAEGLLLILQFGYLLVKECNLLRIVLPLDSLTLYFKLLQPARKLVQLLGHGVVLHTQLCRSLIHEVNGFVWQEAVAYIAFRQLYSRYAGIVLNTHLVVVLITLLQSSQYADGISLVRLVDGHCLEASLQRLVLLEVFLILIESGGTDSPQLASCQRRLQDVGGIHGPLASSCPHKGMNLVDEQYDVAIGSSNLLDDSLQPLLKLSLVFGSSHQGTHIERIELLVLEVFWHVSLDNALSQSLHYGRLSRSRLTYQYRIVLRAAAQYLKHAPNFLITAYHWVELALTGIINEVLGIL